MSTVQAGDGGAMVWGMFSLHTLGLLILINQFFVDYVHPFMATIYSSSNGYFQHYSVPYQKAKVTSN